MKQTYRIDVSFVKLLNNACYIYANQQANIVGKKAVIEAYFKIREWARNHQYNNSIIFIVDKDFFGINWKAPAYNEFVKKYGAKDDDINNFTILDCHSHECYFILENNLKQVFKLLDMEDKLVFNKKEMQEGIEKMKKEIQFSENRRTLESQYLEMKKKFKEHPELLRGHTLFDMLECYLNYCEKKITNCKRYNEKIIKEMDIPLDIKVLKFGFGGYKLNEK